MFYMKGRAFESVKSDRYYLMNIITVVLYLLRPMTNINTQEPYTKMLLTGTKITYVCNMVFLCGCMYKQTYCIRISRYVLFRSKLFSVFAYFRGMKYMMKKLYHHLMHVSKKTFDAVLMDRSVNLFASKFEAM